MYLNHTQTLIFATDIRRLLWKTALEAHDSPVLGREFESRFPLKESDGHFDRRFCVK